MEEELKKVYEHFDYTYNSIGEILESIEQCKTDLRYLTNKFCKSEDIEEISDIYSDLFKLLNFNLIMQIARFDLMSLGTLIIDNNGKPQLQILLRHYVVVIREFYKTIIGFGKRTPYIKDVRLVIEKEWPDLLDEYDRKVDKVVMCEAYIKGLKEYRNLSIHYDKDPQKLWTTFKELKNNFESIYKRSFEFITPLNSFQEFVYSLLQKHDAKYGVPKEAII